MLNFINGFSISATENKTNVVINFAQNYPVPFTDTPENLELEHMGSFIMDEETAHSLATSLLELLDEEVDDNDSYNS